MPLPEDPDVVVPNLSYIVVQKRIDTRIYTQTGPKTFENPEPGVVVDNTITRRCFKDFFLVSILYISVRIEVNLFRLPEKASLLLMFLFSQIPQSVNQGTVTPVHYVVVADYGKPLTPDQIQRVAYKLGHMYYNWPGTVSFFQIVITTS